MKVYDIIREGMEFHASVIEDKDGTKHISPHGLRKERNKCSFCDGTGKDRFAHPDHPMDCDFCDGKKERDEWVSSSPELQVSNSNGFAIVRELFGQEPDYMGHIKNEDLPELRRKLIGMINSEKHRSPLRKDPTDNDKARSMVSHGTEGNVTKIGKSGPRMVDMGRTDEQVKRYAHKMLEIVEYAMKHNLIISWA